MRPCAPHRRTALLCGLVAIGLAVNVAAPSQAADPDREDRLEDRKSGLNDSLQERRGDLGHISRDLVVADRLLTRAQTRLLGAQQELARTRGELAVARARDEQLAADLVEAEETLVEAEGEVTQTQGEIVEQRDLVGAMVADSFQYGGQELSNLGIVLDSGDPAELGEELALNDSVYNSQASALDELDASETLLVLEEERLTELRDEVQIARDAAAENLETKRELTEEAAEQTDAVAAIVATRRTAQQEAAEARQTELDRIAEIEARRDEVKEMLRELARTEQPGPTVTVPTPPSGSSDGGGGGGFSGGADDDSFMTDPAPGAYITSPYGMRMHPILGIYKLHDGTDFGAGCGVPIYAASSGQVVSAYYDGAYGNRVIMANGTVNGSAISTSYNHLTSDVVSVGQSLSKGQLLGYAGTTGYSTGCHLHFMVYVNGSTTDPMGWL